MEWIYTLLTLFGVFDDGRIELTHPSKVDREAEEFLFINGGY